MAYLISEILFALVVAGILGTLLGWLLRGLTVHRELERVEGIWERRLKSLQAKMKPSNSEPGAQAPAPAPAPGPVEAPTRGPDLALVERMERIEASIQARLLALEERSREITDVKDDQEAKQVNEVAAEPPVATEPPAAAAKASTPPPAKDAVEAEIEALVAGNGNAAPPPQEKKPKRRKAAKTTKSKAKTKTAKKPAELDDLKRIRGIGPALEGALNKAGITSYRQIATWDQAEEERVVAEVRTSYRGALKRDAWKSEATDLFREKYGKDP
jgi:predicted flap endonuclease-1-like 5' DNA nuclease